MFAFAIYDQRRRDLFIARDRLGKKPLFYAVFDGVLHFASEIKSLQRSPLWNGDINLEQLEGYLSLGYFIAPATVYRHVRKLEPGHWLRLQNGVVEVRKYWDIEEFDDWEGTERDAVDLIDAQIAERVAERLESGCRSAPFFPAESTPAWSSRAWPNVIPVRSSRPPSASATRPTTSWNWPR
jgi:asparagine synthase (glutamine-hydrolysing)